MQDQPDTKERIARLSAAYESVLKIKPDYPQAMLYLVEIYGILPADKGGDTVKARKYTMQLEKVDAIYGAKARSVLLGEEGNTTGYWEEVLKHHAGNADVLEELGKAYLRIDRARQRCPLF